MARILYFANGSLPDLTSADFCGDSRVIQMSRSMASAGHEVILSPDLGKHRTAGRLDQVPPGILALSHTLHPMPEIFARAQPDLVYFGSYVAYAEPWSPPVPTVVEMGGPTLLEAAFTDDVTGPDLYGYLNGELNALAKADFVVFHGERQQWYYRIPLTLAGYQLDLPPPTGVVPNAVDPAIILPRSMPAEPRFVFAGSIYPWTDPSTAVMSILDGIDARGLGEFHLIGGINNITNGAVRRIATAIDERMARSPRAHRQGFMPLHAVTEVLRTMSVSVEIMSPNLERDLARPFRTPLALACGLPVLLADQDENAALVRGYDAGWVGPPDDASWMRRTIAEILDHPEMVRSKSANAQRLARERFSYDYAIQPLLPFLGSPTRRRCAVRRIGADDLLTRWSPAEKRLLLTLRHPALRGIRSLIRTMLGRA